LIYPYEGQSPTGPIYGSPYTSMCRFENYKKKRVDAQGKEFYSSGRLFLPATDDNLQLELDTKVKIESKTYIIKEKEIMRGFSVSHIECVVV
jgi:hypothetical protein